MFRRNSVTDEVEYQEKYRYELWWKPLTEEARNGVWMRSMVSQWRAGTDTMPVWRVTLVTPVSPYKTGCTPSVYRGCVTLTP